MGVAVLELFHNCSSCVYNCDDQPFISFSAVRKYDLSSIHFFTLCGYITNSQCDQLPDGLIAQSVEHCSAVSQRSWVRIPLRPEFFSGFNFTTAQVEFITAMINHKFVSFSAVQIHDLLYMQQLHYCQV